MKVHPLNKLVAMNTELTLENYRCYKIEALGTDDTAAVTVRIDGKACGVILTELAPLRKNTANFCGPLSLGPYFLVVPPQKTLKFEGTAAKFVHILGKMIELDPGEGMPTDLASRFANQHNEYVKCVEGSDVSTGTAMADGAEVSLYSLTPTTIEKYLFNGLALVDQVAAGSPAEAEGNIGIRLYLDGAPLDHLLSASGRRGIDRMSMEIPNTTDNKSLEPFSLEGNPISVDGDHTIEVKAMNVSGGSLFGTTAAQFHFYAVTLYRKVG
ncbi:hypothetical protein KEJ39_09495 [Candidatus Bathyarchaeota archaeon]|nr:hypothetical protein [Candidatus Bathyarchaeota archaeon]